MHPDLKAELRIQDQPRQCFSGPELQRKHTGNYNPTMALGCAKRMLDIPPDRITSKVCRHRQRQKKVIHHITKRIKEIEQQT
jgi:hypothetical protein